MGTAARSLAVGKDEATGTAAVFACYQASDCYVSGYLFLSLKLYLFSAICRIHGSKNVKALNRVFKAHSEFISVNARDASRDYNRDCISSRVARQGNISCYACWPTGTCQLVLVESQ